jgi:ribonuclease J
VLHTGDYKLDHTPVDGLKTDVGKLAELGNRGIDLLLGDSTNAERPGVTRSERLVGEAFRQIIPPPGPRARRLVRVERPPDAAGDRRRRRGRPQGRVVGRSMRKNVNIAATSATWRCPRAR